MTPGQQGSIQHLPANELDYDTEEAMSTLKSLNEARYETMPTQSLNEKLQVMTNHAACRKAILYLEELFRRCLKTFTCGYTLAWLNLAGKDFVQAVEVRPIVALRIAEYRPMLAAETAKAWECTYLKAHDSMSLHEAPV